MAVVFDEVVGQVEQPHSADAPAALRPSGPPNPERDALTLIKAAAESRRLHRRATRVRAS